MPIRAVIFDFNGVLVDDEHVHFELFRETLAAEGVALDEATYHDRYLGFDDRGCFWNALRESGRDPTDTLINDLIARKAVRYAEVAETGLKFFPHAAETLSLLASRFPVAICSGALRAEIEYALKRLKIRDKVHSITSAEDTDRCKPDPQGYLLALNRLRADYPDLLASECLVIEDSIAGLQAAEKARMIPVGVTHTYSREELKGARAVDVIDGLARVSEEWLDGLSMNQEWFAAAERGDSVTVLDLLGKGIDVNITDPFGRTALWWTAVRSQVEMIRCLLEHGGDPNAQDCTSVTPTTYAAVLTQSRPYRSPDFRPLEMLKAAGGRLGLREAVLMGDVELARRLCDSDPTLDVSGEAEFEWPNTYLMIAAQFGFLDMVKFLLDRGADIEGTDDLGATALMRAADAGHAEIVTLLLDRGADVNNDDWSDQTPLSEAAASGHRGVVDLLLSRGAERGLLDAVALGDANLVKTLLLDDNPSVSLYYRFNDLLMDAVSRGTAEIVRILLDHKMPNVPMKVPYDRPLLTQAAAQGHLEVAKLLIERGADLEAVGSDGLTALDWATKEGHESVVECLKRAAKG